MCCFKNGYPKFEDEHKGPLPKIRAITALTGNNEPQDNQLEDNLKNDGLQWVNVNDPYVNQDNVSRWTTWEDKETKIVDV